MSIRLVSGDFASFSKYVNGGSSGEIEYSVVSGDDFHLSYPGLLIDYNILIDEYISSLTGLSVPSLSNRARIRKGHPISWYYEEYQYDFEWVTIALLHIDPTLPYILPASWHTSKLSEICEEYSMDLILISIDNDEKSDLSLKRM